MPTPKAKFESKLFPTFVMPAAPPAIYPESNYMMPHGHGGFCCGMTHVYNFPRQNPESLVAIRQKTDEQWDQYRRSYVAYSRALNSNRPQETFRERLIGIVSDIATSRNKGIVEVVLTQHQAPYWEEVLDEIGFRLVTTHTNSNSRNTLYVFHLNTDTFCIKKKHINEVIQEVTQAAVAAVREMA